MHLVYFCIDRLLLGHGALGHFAHREIIFISEGQLQSFSTANDILDLYK